MYFSESTLHVALAYWKEARGKKVTNWLLPALLTYVIGYRGQTLFQCISIVVEGAKDHGDFDHGRELSSRTIISPAFTSILSSTITSRLPIPYSTNVVYAACKALTSHYEAKYGIVCGVVHAACKPLALHYEAMYVFFSKNHYFYDLT